MQPDPSRVDPLEPNPSRVDPLEIDLATRNTAGDVIVRTAALLDRVAVVDGDREVTYRELAETTASVTRCSGWGACPADDVGTDAMERHRATHTMMLPLRGRDCRLPGAQGGAHDRGAAARPRPGDPQEAGARERALNLTPGRG